MKKCPCIILLLLLASPFSYGQNLKLIDSLKTKIRTSSGSKRIYLLNDLAWEYRVAYPDSTIYFASQAKALAYKLNYKKDLGKSFNFIGVAQNHKGDRIPAFESYMEALNVSLAQGDSVQLAYSNMNLGRLFHEQGILARAYKYYIQALTLFESLRDSSGLAYSYQSLANLYKTQNDFPKAELNYLRALKMRRQLGNTRDIMAAFILTARLYQENGQDTKALQYLSKADSAGHIIHDEISLAEIKTNMARSELKIGMLDEAEAMCLEGLNVMLSKKNLLILPQAYLTLGQINFNKKNFAAAKKYFNLALDVALKTKDLNSKMEGYYWLWKLSVNDKNEILVLKNYNQYLILKDSIKDLDLTRKVERIQFEIVIQRKEQENELLKVKSLKNEGTIQQQKLQNIFLTVIILFTSLLGFIQWRNIRKRKEINQKLARQNQFIQQQREEIITQNEKLFRRNEELSDINKEKDTLMSFVAHDLKSPLSRIKGISYLLEVEETLTTTQKQYVQIIKDATQEELDIITDLLDTHTLQENVSPSYTTFDLQAFLVNKTEAYRQAAMFKNITINMQASEPLWVNLDADYLNRIIDNLLTNAIKYSNKNSTITVTAGKTDKQWWFAVKDEGLGFTDKDKLFLFQKFKKLSAQPTGGESSSGLGLAIVKTLIDRLNGTIELQSTPGKGSEFSVRFPMG